MATYKSPGVYVEEISKLPASVAQVETAIPAFIGYTATRPGGLNAVSVSSIREYEELFGGPELESYEIHVEDTTTDETVSRSISVAANANGVKHSPYKMYYSLQLFFQNGGGKCYIISIGNYEPGIVEKKAFMDGLDVLEKEDEPTLIVFPDATSSASNPAYQTYYDVVQKALAQAAKLGDRFVIADVFNDDSGARQRSATLNTGRSTIHT
jgi:uncharacterized protein